MKYITTITDGIDGSKIKFYETSNCRGFPILKAVYDGDDPVESKGIDFTYHHLTAALLNTSRTRVFN